VRSIWSGELLGHRATSRTALGCIHTVDSRRVESNWADSMWDEELGGQKHLDGVNSRQAVILLPARFATVGLSTIKLTSAGNARLAKLKNFSLGYP